MEHTTLLLIFSILMLVGVIGVFLPAIPGIPLMMLLAVVFGFVDKFQNLRGTDFIWLAIITLLSIIVDQLSGLLGARYGGASRKALLYGFIGLIIGFFVIPIWGSLAGLFLGVLIAEIQAHKDQKRALKAASGSLLGYVAGMIVNLILAIIFLTLFTILALK